MKHYLAFGYFDGSGVHWMLPDAIGSIELVVSGAGRVEQHTGYYPYGQPWRAVAGQQRLFGGKELRTFAALNDYDFHARRQNPVGPFFESADRHAGNDPARSPWTFAAANPVRFTDPSGLDIELVQDLTLKETLTILLNLQRLTDDRLIFKVEKDGARNIQILSFDKGKGNKPKGTQLIRRLISSKNTVTIDYENSRREFNRRVDKKNAHLPKSEGARKGVPSDARITFSPTYNISKRPAYIGLGHELIHGLHSTEGTLGTRKKGETYNEEEENRTIGLEGIGPDDITENDLREEHGLEHRTQYLSKKIK